MGQPIAILLLDLVFISNFRRNGLQICEGLESPLKVFVASCHEKMLGKSFLRQSRRLRRSYDGPFFQGSGRRRVVSIWNRDLLFDTKLLGKRGHRMSQCCLYMLFSQFWVIRLFQKSQGLRQFVETRFHRHFARYPYKMRHKAVKP